MAALLCWVVSAAAADDSSSPAGTWKWTTQTRDGQSRDWVLNLRVEGDRLLGTVKGPRNETEIQEGKFAAGKVSFTVKRETQRGASTQVFKANLEGDTLKGTIETKNADRSNEREWVAKREGLDLSGTWAWTMKRDNGESLDSNLILKNEQGKISGRFEREGQDQVIEVRQGKLEGNTLTFETVIQRDGDSVVIKNTAVITGKTMKGKAEGTRDGQAWSREWEATKK